MTKDDVLGFTVRLAGENSRGSVVWNNYHHAGIYCDSESPASYVRVDKDGNVYAALDNSDTYRVDGQFDEELRDPRLKWRGSSNQRVIDIKKSQKKGEVVLFCD